MICKAISDGRLPQDCQLIVRLHPFHLRFRNGKPVYQDLLYQYKEVHKQYPFVVFNYPTSLSNKLEADMPNSEMIDVSCMLYYSDVLINHFSTIAVEASFFNLPTINVGFEPGDVSKKTRLKYSSKLAEHRTHNQRIIKMKGVRTVYSEQELIETVNLYLKNRNLDAEGREAIKRNEFGPNPGCAGQHIGQCLLKILEGDNIKYNGDRPADFSKSSSTQ
jgi:predicted glycosyltransferase